MRQPDEHAPLGYLLRFAYEATHERKSAALAEADLTLWGYVVLKQLHAEPGLSQAELSRRARVTPQSLSVTIAGLEDEGLIERRPAAAHARALQASVTPAGRRRLARGDRVLARVEDELLDGIAAKDRALLRRLLAHLASQA